MDLVLHEHILTPKNIIFSMKQTTKTWEQLQLTHTTAKPETTARRPSALQTMKYAPSATRVIT